MRYREEYGNLFDLDNTWAKGHCISQDCVMGKGIADQFCRRYTRLQATLRNQVEHYGLQYPTTVTYYDAECKQLIFNLITKQMYYNKPTYNTINICIKQLAQQCKTYHIEKLTLPKIGCGLDRLEWTKVKEFLLVEFASTDVEILIRYF